MSKSELEVRAIAALMAIKVEVADEPWPYGLDIRLYLPMEKDHGVEVSEIFTWEEASEAITDLVQRYCTP